MQHRRERIKEAFLRGSVSREEGVVPNANPAKVWQTPLCLRTMCTCLLVRKEGLECWQHGGGYSYNNRLQFAAKSRRTGVSLLSGL